MTTRELAEDNGGLERLLSRAYAATPTPELWARLDARMAEAIHQALPWPRARRTDGLRPRLGRAIGGRLRRPLRVSLALALVALLLAVVAVTAIGQIFAPGYFEPGGYMWRNAQQLALTQTVEGYQVTLESVYADVSQLAVAVTVEPPAEVPTESVEPRIKVTDSAGVSWQPTTGGTDPTRRPMKATMQYDATSSSVPSGERAFTFEVIGRQRTFDSAPGVDLFRAVFTASIDVRPGTVVSPGTKASAAGVTVTLDRVVVAPSSVVVDMHWSGLAPAPERTAWGPFLEVRHDGALLSDFSGTGPISGGSWQERTGDGAENASGHWLITVSQLWYDPFAIDGGVPGAPTRVVVPGPWTFEFDVP